MPEVREATVDDIPRALDTFTAAFADYPWTRHTVAAYDHAGRIRRFQELFLVRIGLEHGRVWVGDGGDAAAIWTTPSFDAVAVFGELGPELAEIAGDRAEAAAAAERAMAPHRPKRPAWFLGSVGVHPDRQGRGLGAAVIRPGLEAAAEAGVPAFLETSTYDNVGFYRHLGFEVAAEVTIPDGGPTTWAMTKEHDSSAES
ncbi:MAG: GNAT family N-acetyltransferase [Stackebrandtia sp.]